MGGKCKEHIMACSSEDLLKEWIFILQIINKVKIQNSFRSSLHYLKQQEKIFLLSGSIGVGEKGSMASNHSQHDKAVLDIDVKSDNLERKNRSVDIKSRKQSLYSEEALKTMLRQAKEGDLPVFDDQERSSNESDASQSEQSCSHRSHVGSLCDKKIERLEVSGTEDSKSSFDIA